MEIIITHNLLWKQLAPMGIQKRQFDAYMLPSAAPQQRVISWQRLCKGCITCPCPHTVQVRQERNLASVQLMEWLAPMGAHSSLFDFFMLTSIPPPTMSQHVDGVRIKLDTPATHNQPSTEISSSEFCVSG